jgi:TonB family protein
MATPFPPPPPPLPAKKSSPLVPILVIGGLAAIGIAAAIAASVLMLVSRDRDAHPRASELPVVEKPREPEPAPAFVEPEAQKPPTEPAGRDRSVAPPPAARPRATRPSRVDTSGTGPDGPDLPPPPRRPIRVGGDIPAPTKIHNVTPVYPQIAISARVQGVVVIEATIGPDGKIQDTKVLRSIPLLDQAALDAVRQWEYTPTRLNGEPVPVIMTVTVNFTLQ